MGIVSALKKNKLKNLSFAFIILVGILNSPVTAKAYATGNEVNLNKTKSTSNLNLNIIFGKDKNLQQNVAQIKIKGTSILGGLYKTSPFDIYSKTHTGNLTKYYTFEAKQRYDFPNSYYVGFDVDNTAHFGSFAPTQSTDSVSVSDNYSSSVGFNLGYPLNGAGNISFTQGQSISYQQDAYKTILDLKTNNHVGWKVEFNKFFNEKMNKLVDKNDKELFLSTYKGHDGYDSRKQIDMLLDYKNVPSTMKQFIPDMATEIIADKSKKESIFSIDLSRNTDSYTLFRNNHNSTAWNNGEYSISSNIENNSAVKKDIYKVKINWNEGTAEFID